MMVVHAQQVRGGFPLLLYRLSKARVSFERANLSAGKSAALFAGMALFLAAGFGGCRSTPKLTPEQAEGKHVYDVGCAHCHEENDLHLKKVPPNLHGVLSRKTLPDGEPATDAEVVRVLMTGKGMMPSFTYQLNQAQVVALLAYLHTGMQDEPR